MTIAQRVSRRPALGLGYDVFSTIAREVWVEATRIVAEGDGIAVRRRATRRGFREARRGDYFAARASLRAAKAIEWISSPTPPRHMQIH